MRSTSSTTESARKNPLATAIALLSLLILILLLGLYLGRCLQPATPKLSSAIVLGVSTFTTSASANPVVDGSGVVFTANAAADSNGIVNATVKFDLSGQGVIDNNLHGPGSCVKVTDATAVCNNVNVEANQTATWTVPVTVKSNCSKSSPASLSFQAQLIAPVGTFTSTTGVNCVASLGSNPTSTPTPSSSSGGGSPTAAPTTSTTGGNNGGSTGTNGGTGTNGSGTGTQNGTGAQNGNGTNGQGGTQALNNALSEQALAGLLCYRFGGNGGIPLIGLLLFLWLLAVIASVLYNKRERHTTTEVTEEETKPSKE